MISYMRTLPAMFGIMQSEITHQPGNFILVSNKKSKYLLRTGLQTGKHAEEKNKIIPLPPRKKPGVESLLQAKGIKVKP